MEKSLKNILTSGNGRILPAVLNVISILLSLRGMFKSKSAFWSLVNMVNVGISGYMLIKNARGLLKDR